MQNYYYYEISPWRSLAMNCKYLKHEIELLSMVQAPSLLSIKKNSRILTLRFTTCTFLSSQSTFCKTIVEHCENIGRSVHVVNLDPAAEQFSYPVLGGKMNYNLETFYWSYLVFKINLC